MGCNSPKGAMSPSIPSHHLTRLNTIFQIDHPLNINKKYEYLAKINTKKMTGAGIKKTYTYDCLTTKHQLQKKRKEFWETRTNGSPEIWDLIEKAVAEPNQQIANQILQKKRIHLLNNSIQLCVEIKSSNFSKYEVPIFCIHEPVSYSEVTIADKNMKTDYEDKQLEIKIRSAKFPNEDIFLKELASTEIGTLKQTIRVMKSVQNIRLFYSGKEMGDNKTLGNYNYTTGTIIQGMIS